MDTKERIFKPNHTLNLVLLSTFLLVGIYLKYYEQYGDSKIYIATIVLGCLLIWELYNLKRYSYLIKITKKRLHYKEDKIVIDLKDIIGFSYIPTISYSPSKFVIETTKGEVSLDMPNYNKGKLKKISDALTESIKNLEN